MKYAISMYLGGEPVEPADIAHKETRELGLKCPFCSEAVFLREGFSRIQHGKEVQVEACFVHYRQSQHSSECEVRSHSVEAKRVLAKATAKGREQRLDLYNKHLCRLMETAWGFESGILEKMDNFFRRTGGGRPRDNIVTMLHKEIKEVKLRDENKELIREWMMQPTVENLEQYSEVYFKPYLENWGLEKHYKVAKEVFEFLGTRSGFHAFKLITTYLLKGVIDRTEPEDAHKINAAEILDPTMQFIIVTPWLDSICKVQEELVKNGEQDMSKLLKKHLVQAPAMGFK